MDEKQSFFSSAAATVTEAAAAVVKMRTRHTHVLLVKATHMTMTSLKPNENKARNNKTCLEMKTS